ncbi:MAG: hypothetical protein WC802_05230 [Patescibacteria group bacterium]|jgi:hypothetical protein
MVSSAFFSDLQIGEDFIFYCKASTSWTIFRSRTGDSIAFKGEDKPEAADRVCELLNHGLALAGKRLEFRWYSKISKPAQITEVYEIPGCSDDYSWSTVDPFPPETRESRRGKSEFSTTKGHRVIRSLMFDDGVLDGERSNFGRLYQVVAVP